MGPPRPRSVAFVGALLLLAVFCVFISQQHVAEPIRRRPQVLTTSAATASAASAASVASTAATTASTAVTTAATATTAPATAFEPPSRTINLSCAKAGPHWRADLPKTTTPAVEILPEEAAGPLVRPYASLRQLQPFALADVALANGTHVARAAATNLRYLLSLPTDSLLWSWRRNAGVPQPPHAQPLRGWEAPGSELRGHILGHWLSAGSSAATRTLVLYTRLGSTRVLGPCRDSRLQLRDRQRRVHASQPSTASCRQGCARRRPPCA